MRSSVLRPRRARARARRPEFPCDRLTVWPRMTRDDYATQNQTCALHVMKTLLLSILALAVAVDAAAQRLPGTAIPSHYDLTLAPDLATATFAGDETIAVDLPKPTDRIVLNAAEITFERVTIESNGRSFTASTSLDAERQQATLTVPQPLPAGAATIHITYRGILNDQLRGFYLSKTAKRRYA